MGGEEQCEWTEVDEDRLRGVQERLIDGLTATRLAHTFKALSDPTRVRIISALSHNELCVHELAACLGMSQSAISHQLRTLREMRLVRRRKEGRHVYYILDDEHIHDLFHQGLEHVEHE
ncbi:MAG TPA: ArsR family transcriptional regulator [Anaerolineales bacterium]|nr:ArsR family transcriptional regulator [Anaerolineae bacterium]HIP87146.1 ArsR family transcriptional regulator [Anaerolineales bacterium]